jgi:hypothetical protein
MSLLLRVILLRHDCSLEMTVAACAKVRRAGGPRAQARAFAAVTDSRRRRAQVTELSKRMSDGSARTTKSLLSQKMILAPLLDLVFLSGARRAAAHSVAFLSLSD